MNFLKIGTPQNPSHVPAIHGGKMTYVAPHEVDYELPSSAHMFTETSNLVPAASTMKGARLMIASKYFTQALPLKDQEAPLVDSLNEETGEAYGKAIGHKIGLRKSKVDGVVAKVDPTYIDIKDTTGKIHRHELHHFFPHNRKTHTTDTPLVKPGDVILQNQPIAHSNYVDKEGHLALGKNLQVAFMAAPGGASFEDAILVSERAANKLTSRHLYPYDVEHKNGVESSKARFLSLFPNRYTKDQIDKIGPNGMVKPGVELNPGDPIFLSLSPRTLSSKERALGNLHKVLRHSFRDLSQTWDKSTPGHVADAVELRHGHRVNIATDMPLKEGDKISGRSGAKGLVSKVVSNDQMIRGADGEPIDVIINPAALIGRVNPQMVFESLLGKIAKKHGKKYLLPAFSSDSTRDYVEQELAKHGIPDTEEIYDPQSGRRVPGILTGNQYFLKLEHTGESKLSGRGEEGGSDINEQPAKGGETGSKRIGTLDLMALVSHGAKETLRDAQIYRGSRNEDLWRKIRTGEPLPTPDVPFIYKKFLETLRAAGINVQRNGSKLNIMGMTDRDVSKIAPYPVQNSETINPKSGNPIPGGLFDFSIHGGPEGKQWSHIPLLHPYPNPLMEDPIRRMLGLTQKSLRNIVSGEETLHGKTGPQAISKALADIDLNRLEETQREIVRSGRKAKRDDAVKLLHHVVGLKKAGLSPSDLMISKVPVIPPVFRPVAFMGNIPLSADANYLYKDLMTAQDAYRHNQQHLPEGDLKEERLAVYDAIKAVQGMGEPMHEETRAKGVKGFIRQVAGTSGPKSGLFMSKVLGHAVNTVGRGAIIPDSSLDMDHVGIPEKMAWRIFGPFVMRRMVREGMPAAQAAEQIEKQSNFAKKFLLNEMDHRPVLYNRAPALHRFSVMGAKAILRAGNSIAISPLVVKPFNADFDGDQMNIHVPISDEAVEEVKNKLLPSQNLLSIKDRQVHYTPSQEFILGLWNATSARKNQKPVIFNSRQEALEAYRKKIIDMDSPVIIKGE